MMCFTVFINSKIPTFFERGQGEKEMSIIFTSLHRKTQSKCGDAVWNMMAGGGIISQIFQERDGLYLGRYSKINFL